MALNNTMGDEAPSAVVPPSDPGLPSIKGSASARPALDPRDRWALAFVFAAKLILASTVAPAVWPDTAGYLAFTDALLDPHRSWLLNEDWGLEPSPGLFLRTAGYPLLLAAARLVGGDWAPTLVLVFQTILSCAALLVAYRLYAFLTDRFAWRMAFLFLTASSLSLLFDVSLLSDSLYASLFLFGVLPWIGCLIGAWRGRWWWWPLMGIGWGWSIWTRDAGLYFTLLPVLLGLVLAVGGLRPSTRISAPSAASGRRAALSWLMAVAMFVGPVVGMVAAYRAWNEARTGHAFLSIVSQHNWARPVFDMAATGLVDPFARNDRIGEVVRADHIRYPFPDHLAYIDHLFEVDGLSSLEIQRLALAKFLDTVKSFPLAYLAEVVETARLDRVAFTLTDPIYNANAFLQYGPIVGHRVVPGVPDLVRAVRKRGEAGALVPLVVIVAARVVSVALFALFAIGAPWMVVRAMTGRGAEGAAWNATTRMVACCWFGFFLICGAYALVHFEDRHALPVIPLGVIGVLLVLHDAIGRVRTRLGGGSGVRVASW